MTNSRILAAAAAATVLTLSGSIATAADGTWNVDAAGNWSNSANWLNGIVADGADATANFTFDITAGRIVTNDTARTIGNINFNDTGATGDVAWTLTGTAANPLTFSTASGTSNITSSSTIGFGAGATISALLAGSNNLVFNVTPTATTSQPQIAVTNAANSYTGTTAISNGFLNVGANNLLVSTNGALGNSATAIIVGNAATSTAVGVNTGQPSVGLDVLSSGAAAASFSIARNIDSSTTADVAGRTNVRFNNNTAAATGTLTVSGNWALGTNTTHSYGLVAQQAGQTLNFTGNITGTGATATFRLNDFGNGNGTIRLSGTNTYAGATLLEAGALVVGGNAPLTNGALGNGATLQLASSGVTSLNSASVQASIGALTDGGYTVNKPVTLNASQVAATGGTAVQQAYSWSLGGSSANASLFTGNVNTTAIAFSRTLNVVQAAGGTSTFSGVIGANTDANNVTTVEKTGAGTVVLAGNNTYDGNTRVTNGTLLVNNVQVAGVGSGTGAGAVNVGVVSAAVSGVTSTTLGATAARVTRQLDGISLAVANGLQVGQTVTGTGIAAGTVVQSIGFNATTGTASVGISTTVTVPTLAAAPGGLVISDLAFGALTTTGALGGSGTISGPITVNAGSGLSPGATTALGSTSNLTGSNAGAALTLAAGSSSVFDINGTVRGTDYDAFTASSPTGTITYGGALTIFGNALTTTTYDLFSSLLTAGDFSSVTLITGGSNLITLGETGPGTGVFTATSGANAYTFTTATGDLVVAVPEPAALGLLAGGAVLLGSRRRRVA